MGVSKGGSSGDQASTTSGNTAYNSSGATTANQTGNTNTSQTQTSNGQTTGQTAGSFQTGVTTPDGYTASWQGSQPTTLGDQASNYFTNQSNRPSYTLGSLAGQAAAGTPGYSSYAAPTPVSADSVAAGTGASYMGNYTAPWNDVTNSALNAYDVGADKTIGAFKGANAPFAGNDRIGSLGQAALTNEIAAGRGNLSGQLLGQGYTTAANLGQQDATRAAGVDTGNADRTLNADQYNNSQTTQRQEFDVGAAQQGDASRDAVANSQLNAESVGNTGNNQWLQLGQALFGQSGTNAGTTAGTSDTSSQINSLVNSIMNSVGTSSESGTGSSSGTSAGNSSSKGGGLSLG